MPIVGTNKFFARKLIGNSISKGHALIIPKRHVDNFFDLSLREQTALFFVLNHVKNFLQKRFNPDGFNVGINIGEKAGQTIPHVHIHLIPRYSGDMKDPEGGVRGVIPEKRKYLHQKKTS